MTRLTTLMLIPCADRNMVVTKQMVNLIFSVCLILTFLIKFFSAI